MVAVKRVAVIGAGPAGAITVDALAQEKYFDLIRVFERREAAGGCWIGDESPPPLNTDFHALSSRTADPPVPVPERLPSQTPKLDVPRYADSSVYPYMESNVDAGAMSFSQEPIPEDRSARSIALHGHDTPFRHWTTLRRYVQGLLQRNGYEDLVSYGTTVEKAEKVGHEWKVTLRKEGSRSDYWWVEWFDAVIVASGHYSVPYIPDIEGLDQFEKFRPGSVVHSKNFRGKESYADKRVVVVGASVSAADITYDLTSVAQAPVHAVVNGHKANVYFGDEAFNHPLVQRQPSIARIEGRDVHFVDGKVATGVDHVVFGTGYSWTLPFLPQVEVRNNRVPRLYQHVVYQKDPSLLFVGAVAAGLTFKIFEWQAVLAARLLSGRSRPLPGLDEQERWERERVAARGDGVKFTLVYPDFEDYFETVRALAGPGEAGFGRHLPPFKREWFKGFLDGHERRKAMWRRLNVEARAEAKQDRANRVGEVGFGAGGDQLVSVKESLPPAYDWQTVKQLPVLIQALQSLQTKSL